MKKIFRSRLMIKECAKMGIPFELILDSTGWMSDCEGREVVDGLCYILGNLAPYRISDAWCEVVE